MGIYGDTLLDGSQQPPPTKHLYPILFFISQSNHYLKQLLEQLSSWGSTWLD